MKNYYFSEEKNSYSGSKAGLALPTRGHLAMSGDVFGCPCQRGGNQWVESRDAML